MLEIWKFVGFLDCCLGFWEQSRKLCFFVDPLLFCIVLCWLCFVWLIFARRWMAAQSIFYHLYNQVSYMSLDEISPLTFSIGNTMKRISVIVSSIIIFQTPIQPVNALGAAIAVFGTFLYSQVICSL